MPASDLAPAVAGYVERHHLLPPGPVVIAFSGGPDSLCLLHLLADLAPARGWRLVAAHLDHGLRPESAAEVAAVQALAAARGVPLRAGRADVAALAAERGRGIEAAGRVARYRFLAAVAAAEGGAPVATGHTADDQAETLLLRLARGAGLTGLAAMRPATLLPPDAWDGPPGAAPLRLVRPLLATGRAAVEAELARRGLTPLRDPTNADPAYARNRLRQGLLAAWQALDPGIATRLARTADLLAEDEEYLEAQTERLWQTLDPQEGSLATLIPGFASWSQRAEMPAAWHAPVMTLSLHRAALLDQPLAMRRRLLRFAIARLGGGAPKRATVDGALAAVAGRSPMPVPLSNEILLSNTGARLVISRVDARPVGLPRAWWLAQPADQRRHVLRQRATSDQTGPPTEAGLDAALAVGAGEAVGPADLGNGRMLVLHHEGLWIVPHPASLLSPPSGPWMTTGMVVPLAIGGPTILPGGGWVIECRQRSAHACALPLSGFHAHLKPALAAAAPVVRTWRPGDRIAPPNMRGRKKLSDFFIDRKVPRAERATVPLLVAGDSLAWVVGRAVGEPWRATGAEPGVVCCTIRPAVEGLESGQEDG